MERVKGDMTKRCREELQRLHNDTRLAREAYIANPTKRTAMAILVADRAYYAKWLECSKEPPPVPPECPDKPAPAPVPLPEGGKPVADTHEEQCCDLERKKLSAAFMPEQWQSLAYQAAANTQALANAQNWSGTVMNNLALQAQMTNSQVSSANKLTTADTESKMLAQSMGNTFAGSDSALQQFQLAASKLAESMGPAHVAMVNSMVQIIAQMVVSQQQTPSESAKK